MQKHRGRCSLDARSHLARPYELGFEVGKCGP